MQQLYFVRHGESELNARHIFAGQTDTLLSARGKEQAALAGKGAQSLSIDLIVSSPLNRALTTAQIIAKSVGYPIDKIIVNDMFKERSLGSLEGMSWEGVDEAATNVSGIETWDELLARAKAGLEYLKSLDAKVILLAGHGSHIRALRTVVDPHNTYPEPPNAQIVQLI
jgi:uncharacterized phosphatase